MEEVKNQQEIHVPEPQGPQQWILQGDRIIMDIKKRPEEFLSKFISELPTQVSHELSKCKTPKGELPTKLGPNLRELVEWEGACEEFSFLLEPETQGHEEVEEEVCEEEGYEEVVWIKQVQGLQPLPDVDQRLKEANKLLWHEKHERYSAEHEAAIERHKLHETEKILQKEQRMRLKREKEVQRLREQVSTLSPASAAPRDELLDEFTDINHFNNQTAYKNKELVQRLQEEKTSLEQQKELQLRQVSEEKETACVLEDLQRQLDVMSCSNLELASSLRAQEEACQSLTQQMMLQKSQKLIPEDVPQTETAEDLREIQRLEKPSRWRRFKKLVTPKHRRQYKSRQANE